MQSYPPSDLIHDFYHVFYHGGYVFLFQCQSVSKNLFQNASRIEFGMFLICVSVYAFKLLLNYASDMHTIGCGTNVSA